jgi:hypothetical protein
LIKREWKDLEARQKYGYPEGKVYTVQANAWMDEQAMMKWVDAVRGPYTKDPRHDGLNTYLLQDEFSVHLIVSVNNQINKWGAAVDIIPGPPPPMCNIVIQLRIEALIQFLFSAGVIHRQMKKR